MEVEDEESVVCCICLDHVDHTAPTGHRLECCNNLIHRECLDVCVRHNFKNCPLCSKPLSPSPTTVVVFIESPPHQHIPSTAVLIKRVFLAFVMTCICAGVLVTVMQLVS